MLRGIVPRKAIGAEEEFRKLVAVYDLEVADGEVPFGSIALAVPLAVSFSAFPNELQGHPGRGAGICELHLIGRNGRNDPPLIGTPRTDLV
jgi:hypothetical protein